MKSINVHVVIDGSSLLRALVINRVIFTTQSLPKLYDKLKKLKGFRSLSMDEIRSRLSKRSGDKIHPRMEKKIYAI